MHPFIETISVAGGIAAAFVGAIIVLALFFASLSWLSGGSKPGPLAVRGILQKDSIATVHVAGHPPFKRVRFLGYTDAQHIKTRLPLELNGMVILEDNHQTRFLVRARDIRMIIVPPEQKTT